MNRNTKSRIRAARKEHAIHRMIRRMWDRAHALACAKGLPESEAMAQLKTQCWQLRGKNT